MPWHFPWRSTNSTFPKPNVSDYKTHSFFKQVLVNSRKFKVPRLIWACPKTPLA